MGAKEMGAKEMERKIWYVKYGSENMEAKI